MEVSGVSQVKFVMFVSGPHGTQCFTSQVGDVPGPHQIFVNCLLHIQKARFCLHDQVQCYTIWYLVSFQALIRFLSVACSAESRVWVWGQPAAIIKRTGVRSLSLAECSSLGTILVNCAYCLQKPVAGPQCVSPAACTGNLAALKLPMLNMYSGQTHCHSNRTPSTNIYI